MYYVKYTLVGQVIENKHFNNEKKVEMEVDIFNKKMDKSVYSFNTPFQFNKEITFPNQNGILLKK